MFTGAHPRPRGSAIDIMHAILHDDPPVSGAFRQIATPVRKLLSKDPGDRYASAREVLEALASSLSPEKGQPAAAIVSESLNSIAVSRFVFLQDIADRKALALGFADALITMLGGLQDIRVLPTSAILNYAAGADAAGVCRDLGVRHALQGNVQRMGALWRVSIQIFDSEIPKITFSEKHDFNMDSVFELQDEIGRRVVESLQTRFPRALAKSRDRCSSDPEAYDEFIAGLRESYSDQPDALKRAVQHLTGAIERRFGARVARLRTRQCVLQLRSAA